MQTDEQSTCLRSPLYRLAVTLLDADTVEDLVTDAPAAIAAALGPRWACRLHLFGSLPPAPIDSEAIGETRLCAPIRDQGQLLGAIVVIDLSPSQEEIELDEELLGAIGDLVATAVATRQRMAAEHARLRAEAAELRFDAISMLSHEMRTPLASIKGYATALLLDGANWDDATRAEFLHTIDEESDRLTAMIEGILESAAIDAGELTIELELVLLPRIAKRVVDRMTMRTDRHRFAVMFPPDFPWVEADAQRIEQVLANLVDNAVKYSPDGGLIILRGEVRPNEVVVSVVDQGVGIAPEDLNKLFERFFRASTNRRHVAGTGLGLPISDLIVRGHGGRIWAESTVGSGTTLSFSLPHPREKRVTRQND